MNETMDIKTIFHIFKKRAATILTTMICVSLLAVLVAFYFVKPTYEATEYLLVGTLKNGDTYVDPRTVDRLLASSIDIITSPIVLDTVQSEMNISRSDLEEKLTVKNNENSQIVNIIVRDTHPEQAKQLANLLAVTSIEKMKSSLQMDEMVILSDPNEETTLQTVGSTKVNIAIGVAVGLLLGIALAILRELMDDTVRSVSQLEQETGAIVLGEVNIEDDKLLTKRHKLSNRKSVKKESGGEIRAESH